MGEGTNGVSASDDTAKAEREVTEVRDRLTGIVRELDRRRHAVMDIRGQLRRHQPAVAISAGTLVLLAGGAIWLATWLNRRQQRPLAKAHRLRLALGRAIAHPDEVARTKPGLGKKVLSVLITTAVGVVAKALTQRLVAQMKLAEAH